MSGLTEPLLLGPASLLLQGYGYSTQHIAIDTALTMVLAENAYFALGIVEFGDAMSLPEVESRAVSDVATRLSGDGGAKRWDVYVVLMTRAAVEGDSMPESIAAIIYNTHFVRRVVRWSVQPEPASLARALRPFLPLTSAEAGGETGPLNRLVARLPLFGVTAEEAEQAIAEWRAMGRSND